MSDDSANLQSAISLSQASTKEDLMINIGEHKYKGYTFATFNQPETLDALQTFEVRDDDVYIVTYPKSGTHWIGEIVALVMEDGVVEKVNRELMATALEITLAPSPEKVKQSTPGYKIYEKLPSPRLMASHIPEPLCPPQWFTKNAKIIYFARNPKDVLASQYNFLKPMIAKLQWDDFFKSFLGDNVLYGPWCDHVLRYWKHRDRDNFLFLKYEDCHKDLKGTVTKVAKFLGKTLPDDVIENITQQCTLHGMKKAYEKIEKDYPEQGKMLTHMFGQISYLRKGVVGSWKEHFTPEQNKIFDKYYAEKMAGSGLTFDFEL